MQFDPVLRTILTQLFHLHAGKLVLDCLVLVYCRYIVIWSGNGAMRVFHANPSFLQIQESHGRSNFVNEVLVDEKYIRASRHGFDYVRIPDFIK